MTDSPHDVASTSTALRLADGLWLLLLLVYLIAGIPSVPFHPDEGEHIRMSGDSWILFVDRDPLRLADVIDPATGAPRDKIAALRLIDAPLHGYAMGLAWQLAGFTVADLPPFWDWGLTYAGNVALGHRPSPALLRAARTASVIFVWLTAVVLLALGSAYAGRWAGWLASGLFATNPVVLLHARRAMHEAPLLFFGTLTMWIALAIVRRLDLPSAIHAEDGSVAKTADSRGLRARDEPPRRRWWYVALAISGGLTIGAKHTGAVIVVAVLLWVLIAELRRRGRMPDRATSGIALVRVGACGVGALAVFLAITPGLWSNPIARLRDTIALRAEMVRNQVAGTPGAPLSLPQRLEWIATEPFLATLEPAHDPREQWRYGGSRWSGVAPGGLVGALLTALAAIGLLESLRGTLTSGAARMESLGIALWTTAVVAALLANPLPWQRYFLPLLPLASLLVGIGAHALARAIDKRTRSKS